VASHTDPLISAAKTFLAKPSDMDLAISSAELPLGYWRTAPSGNVIFINSLIKSRKINKSIATTGVLKKP
jgi:hypothetical protein